MIRLGTIPRNDKDECVLVWVDWLCSCHLRLHAVRVGYDVKSPAVNPQKRVFPMTLVASALRVDAWVVRWWMEVGG
jgi:hypothetical protein